jgi:hypothetical protein
MPSVPGSSNGSAPTPPSAPSSGPEPRGARPRARGGRLLVVVAAAALASAWNLLGAPFALLAGVLCAALAVRDLVGGRSRLLAAVTLALGAGAAVAAATVLLATVGVGGSREEKLEVEVRTPAEVRQALDEAAKASQPARDRARRELQELPGQDPGRPAAPGRPAPGHPSTPPGGAVR